MTSAMFTGNEKGAHDWAREKMSAFLDGQLAGSEVAEFEAHLTGCAPCRNEMQAIRTTRQLLRAMPMARLPRPFTLEAAPRRAVLPRVFFLLRGASAVAAAAFVALLAVSAILPTAGPVSTSAPAFQTGQRGAAPVASQTSSEASSAASQGLPQRTAPAAAASKPAPQVGAAAPAVAGAAAVPNPKEPVSTQAAPAAVPAPALGSAQVPPANGEAGATAPQSAAPAPRAVTPEQAPSATVLTPPSRALLPLQFLAGALAVAFAIASGAVWWIHRRRQL